MQKEFIDEIVSKYYDKEMNTLELMNFEAKMALDDRIKEYSNNKCMDYYRISRSIGLIKHRLLKENKKLIFDIDSIISESFNKHLGNRILNILRNNS